MLGLNLNISFPFSPLPDISYPQPTPEEEVDAVTGKKRIMIHSLLQSVIST